MAFALVVPDIGERSMLDNLNKNTTPEAFTLKLYSNNFDCLETSVAGDFTECSGSGYASKSLTRANYNSAVTPASGTITVAVDASLKTFTRSAGSYITDGFFVDQTVDWTGFTNGGNNSSFVISTLTATVMTCSTATGLVNEGPTATASVRGPSYSLYNAVQTFSFTGPITVVGAYIVGATSGNLYLAQRLFSGAGQLFNNPDSLGYTPYLEAK